MELHSYLYDVIAEAEGQNEIPSAGVYLLDADFTVLAEKGSPAPSLAGERFFGQYVASRAVQAELYAHLQGFSCGNLLLPTRRGAVLVIGTLFSSCGLIPVILPPDGLREVFDRPAALYGILPGLSLSERLLAGQAKHSPAALRLAGEWYHRVYRAFCFGEGAEGKALLSAMQVRIRRLAELVGCGAEFDLSGMGERDGAGFELGIFTGAVLAALLAAKHSLAHKPALYIDRAYPRDPILHVCLETEEREIPAFAPICRCAALRGMAAQTYWQQGMLYGRFSLYRAALEEQDVKERHPLVSRILQNGDPIGARQISSALCEQASELKFDGEN